MIRPAQNPVLPNVVDVNLLCTYSSHLIMKHVQKIISWIHPVEIAYCTLQFSHLL